MSDVIQFSRIPETPNKEKLLFTVRVGTDPDLPLHMCFVDLDKAYDQVPRDVLWEVLREYGVRGSLFLKARVCTRK